MHANSLHLRGSKKGKSLHFLPANVSETTSKAKIYERETVICKHGFCLQPACLHFSKYVFLRVPCNASQMTVTHSHTHTHANMHAHTCEVRGGMTQRSSAFCSMLIRVLPFVQLNTFMLAQCHDRDRGTPCHTVPYQAMPGHIAPYNHTHLSPTGCEAYFIGFCLPVKRMEQNTRAHVRIVVI